jgi:hypothetical protein
MLLVLNIKTPLLVCRLGHKRLYPFGYLHREMVVGARVLFRSRAMRNSYRYSIRTSLIPHFAGLVNIPAALVASPLA